MQTLNKLRGWTAGIGRCTGQLLDGQIVRVPLDLVSDEYGFSLGDDGWHYFRALLADQQRGCRPEDSAFWQFFRHPLVRELRDVNDVLFLHDPQRRQRGRRFHFNSYPWGMWSRKWARVGGWPFGKHYDQANGQDTRDRYGYRANIWYEPGDEHALAKEWRQFDALFQDVRREYSPVQHGAFPEVVMLRRRDGQVRYVRYHGHHRLTCLAHLGHKSASVVIPRASLQVIEEAQVDRWYYVRKGLCSAADALNVFHAFFELNGRERARYLSIPITYGNDVEPQQLQLGVACAACAPRPQRR